MSPRWTWNTSKKINFWRLSFVADVSVRFTDFLNFRIIKSCLWFIGSSYYVLISPDKCIGTTGILVVFSLSEFGPLRMESLMPDPWTKPMNFRETRNSEQKIFTIGHGLFSQVLTFSRATRIFHDF